MNHMEKLWFGRAMEFWREALQYGSYVARSGFIVFLFGGFIVGLYFYNQALATLPVSFPYEWITTPVIFAVLIISPIRTFVKPADAVFLLPAEKQMNRYFRKSWTYSWGIQAIITIIACLAIWPLYRHCLGEQKEPLVGLLLFLLLNKTLHLLSSWQEGRIIYQRNRTQIKYIRWLFTLVVVYILFVYGSLLAAIPLLVGSLMIFLAIKRADLHTIPWDYLIKTEQRHVASHYLFYSWFIDVPQRTTLPKARTIWSQWTRLYSFKPLNTFLYLYTKSFLRSELFGILQRTTGLSILILVSTPNSMARIVIYGLVIFISSVQITVLEQQHRYSFWLIIYPLQPEWRVNALAKIIFYTITIQSLLLAFVLLFVNVNFLLIALCFSLGCLLNAIYSFVIYPRKLRHRLF